MSPRRLPAVGMSLSGGGYGGAGALIGFACAVDVFLGPRHSVTDLASYSGISAGAIVASYLAAGISPLEMVYAHYNPGHGPFRSPRRSDLYEPNWRELPGSLQRLGRAGLRTLQRLGRRGLTGVEPAEVTRLGLLPSGLLSNRRLERMVRHNLESYGVNDFRRLDCRLRIVFYDLLGNQRIVAGNGADEVSDLPIAEAVTASAAIPGVFSPRRIEHQGRTLLGVDGGTAGVTLEMRGADALDVLFAYNHVGYAERPELEHVSALAVLSMSRQLHLNQRNRDEVASYIDSHPTRHVWMFESPDRPFSDMLSYRALYDSIGETFELTKTWLARHRRYFALVLEAHGVDLNPDFEEVAYEDVKRQGVRLKAR